MPGGLEQWEYADLRRLDAADAIKPSLDLLAIYTRYSEQDLQIRLDWLDHPIIPDYDLYLAIDHSPGGSRDLPVLGMADLDWDTLIVIPAYGPIKVISSPDDLRLDIALRILRDPIMDYVTISINHAAVGRQGFSIGQSKLMIGVQAFLTASGSPDIADQLDPIRTDDPAPQPARILFVFWNTYPAYTPALALRRWDGAHTGPLGGRHGLENLIRTAGAAGMPITLLDLKNPTSLAALDFTGGLNRIREGILSGALILPEFIPGMLPDLPPSPFLLPEEVLQDHRQFTKGFGLPTSPFVYTPPWLFPDDRNSRLFFTRIKEDSSGTYKLKPIAIARWREQRVIPIPEGIRHVEQATLSGLSLETRRALIGTAMAASEGLINGMPILVLGGDLPTSTWGEPQTARATFRYIAAHPWMQPLIADELLSIRPMTSFDKTWQSSNVSDRLPADTSSDLLLALHQTPDNALRNAAWQAYLSLAAPGYPEVDELPALRSAYLGGIWSLISAAEWAAEPDILKDCTLDPDHDSQTECILSSEKIMTIFEIESGTLAYAFSRSHMPDGKLELHQWIGPSSQLIVGLSEPDSWDTSRGIYSDPDVIPGAFAEPGMDYRATLDGEILIFTSSDGQRQKKFILADDRIRVEYLSLQQPLSPLLSLPIILDPWERFSMGWADRFILKSQPGVHSWGFPSGPRLIIHTTSQTTWRNFADSRPYMTMRENPNIDYPGGHFLPFPLSLAEILVQGYAEIELILDDG